MAAGLIIFLGSNDCWANYIFESNCFQSNYNLGLMASGLIIFLGLISTGLIIFLGLMVARLIIILA